MHAFPILIVPGRQEVWGLAAVINFSAGGAGSVLYALSFLMPMGGSSLLGMSPINFMRLFAVFLVASGFALVGAESRKPKNARFLLNHLKRSWMSREVLAGGLFIILAFLDIVSHLDVFEYSALLMAMLLLGCQVMMIYDAKGVTAWNTVLVALHALSSNVALAWSIGLIFFSMTVTIHATTIIAVVLISLIINSILWWLLLKSKLSADLREALQPLITPWKLTIGIGVGHLVPGLMLLVSLGMSMMLGADALVKLLLGLSGILIAIGVTTQKAGIILEANALKGIRPGTVNPGIIIHKP